MRPEGSRVRAEGRAGVGEHARARLRGEPAREARLVHGRDVRVVGAGEVRAQRRRGVRRARGGESARGGGRRHRRGGRRRGSARARRATARRRRERGRGGDGGVGDGRGEAGAHARQGRRAGRGGGIAHRRPRAEQSTDQQSYLVQSRADVFKCACRRRARPAAHACAPSRICGKAPRKAKIAPPSRPRRRFRAHTSRVRDETTRPSLASSRHFCLARSWTSPRRAREDAASPSRNVVSDKPSTSADA